MRKYLFLFSFFLIFLISGCKDENGEKAKNTKESIQTKIPNKEPEGFKSIHQRDYEKYKKDSTAVDKKEKKKEVIRFN